MFYPRDVREFIAALEADGKALRFTERGARAPGPFTADPSQLPWRNLKAGMRTGPNGPAFTAPAPPDSRPKVATQPNAMRSAAG